MLGESKNIDFIFGYYIVDAHQFLRESNKIVKAYTKEICILIKKKNWFSETNIWICMFV